MVLVQEKFQRNPWLVLWEGVCLIDVSEKRASGRIPIVGKAYANVT